MLAIVGSEGFYCIVSTKSLAVFGDTGKISIGGNPEVGIMGILPVNDVVGISVIIFPGGRMGILADDDAVGVITISFPADG